MKQDCVSVMIDCLLLHKRETKRGRGRRKERTKEREGK
jgi:hypothetical protein